MNGSPILCPLPDSKLPQVHVSADALAHWKSEAKSTVRSVIHNRQSWYFRFQEYQHLYKPIYAKHNTYGCARAIKHTNVVEFLGRAELYMTLDELAYSLRCKTTFEQRAVYAQLYQDACIDGALLKRFEGQSWNDPFHSVAVKWVALRSPMGKIFKGSDFIYFEYSFTTTDLNGRKVLIEFKKSQPFRPDQLQDHDLDLTRGSMFVLNTYSIENKRVVMHTMGEHDVARSFPLWFALSIMPTFFERVQNHLGLVYSRSLADAGVTADSLIDQPCMDEEATGCSACGKKFNLVRGKKWCRRCGCAVCRDCVAKVIILKTKAEATSWRRRRLPFIRKRFCSLCLYYARALWAVVDHDSKKERPSTLLSICPEDLNTWELSHLTAAVISMDRFLDRTARYSMDESLVSLSTRKADDQKPVSALGPFRLISWTENPRSSNRAHR